MSIELAAEVLSVIRGEFSKVRVPSLHDKVYKDECCVSFDSPFSDTGLYVNISSLQGYGADYWRADAQKTGNKLYLHEVWTQTLKPKVIADNGDEAAPTKLAIGTSDGFNVMESQYDLTKEHALVVLMPSGEATSVPLPNSTIPEFISNVLNGIIAHDGMKSKMQVDTWSADSEIKESKYAAGLVQLDNQGKKISSDPQTWVCEMSGAKDNLWLNLSTGYIGGGRKNWDGTGGSGGALQHYEETGKQYPLCVKLGTVTAHGGDIWSYAADEDTLVKDSNLASHLSHWGIDIQRMEKTDSSMAELEVNLNMKYDWTKIMEGGAELLPLSGPGLVGLRNIGSSCYMNSVLQAFVAVPQVQERYLGNRAAILASCPAAPSEDFAVQMSKLTHAMLTDKYCAPLSADAGKIKVEAGEAAADASTLEKYVVAPRMLKHLVAKGHPEFSGGRQQDAAEYFQYFLDQMSRAERTALSRFLPADALPTSSFFEFQSQPKFKCSTTGQVKYPPAAGNNLLELRIPLEAAINRAEVEREEEMKEAKRSKLDASIEKDKEAPKQLEVPFAACLAAYFADEQIEFQNPSLGGASGPHTSNTRFRSFPQYLMVKLGRYTMGDNWVQVKIDARVPVPETLNLSAYAREGLADGEEEMPEAPSDVHAAPPAATVAEADAAVVAQLMSMGFSENGSKRAALATGNSDAEMAMNWVFAHMEDADFNDPPAAPADTAAAAPTAVVGISPDMIEMLMNYGFNEIQCTAALTATNSNIERAADWLFSHDNAAGITAETVAAMNSDSSGGSEASSSGADARVPAFGAAGTGEYELMSIISHIGRNTDHGHYVCHRKLPTGEWALFNDEKVAQSGMPPLEHGFMYLFRKTLT